MITENIEAITKEQTTIENLIAQIEEFVFLDPKMNLEVSDSVYAFNYGLYVDTGNEAVGVENSSSADYTADYNQRRLVYVRELEELQTTLTVFWQQLKIQQLTNQNSFFLPYIHLTNNLKSSIDDRVLARILSLNQTGGKIQSINSNQYSTSLARSSEGVIRTSQSTIDFHLPTLHLRAKAKEALEISQKQHYIQRRSEYIKDNPNIENNLIPMPPTLIVSLEQIIDCKSFEELQRITGLTDQKVIWLKGCNDAGGENIGRFDKDNFQNQWQAFQLQIQEKSQTQINMQYLAQGSVEIGEGETLEGLCLNFDLPDDFDINNYDLKNILQINRQVYADESKKTFCGTIVDNQCTAQIIEQFGSQIKATLELLHNGCDCKGSFIYDVMLKKNSNDNNTSINSIADLAQRSSGSSRAIGNLRALESDKVLSLNKFVNIELDELTRLLGDNIFDNNTKKSCLPTPRSGGWFDLSFFGMEQDEIDTTIDNLTNYVNQNPNNSEIKAVYF